MRANCRELTETSPVPWVILSAGETFKVFQHQVEIACQEGASGFMVGRAIWQEGMTMPQAAQRDRFLETTAVSRLQILTAIANAYATPWKAKFPDLGTGQPMEEGWHIAYEA